MAIQWVLNARNGQMLEPKGRPRYSNQQRILTVGDGDFSFSSCVATEVGVAYNMVATSLDTRGELWQKYGMDAKLNLSNLAQRGVGLVFHGFDACKMATEVTEQTDLLRNFQMSYFDCIVFNFPHAGFLGREDDPNLLMKHKELVRLFFANARRMLLPGGQVHVSHKLGPPYDKWKLEEQAQVSGLTCVGRVPFHREHYPGYQNRRGDGSRAGESFKLGPADTFIFVKRILVPPARTWNVGEPQGISITMLAHPNSLKEKAVCKAHAPHVTSLQQAVADEATGPEKLQLGKKKMKRKTLAALKPTSQQMDLENSPTSLSCTTTDKPSASTLNVCEPLGMSITMLVHLKSLKEKAIRKAGASEETSLQQVVVDEVTRLEKLKEEEKLGKKKMKTLETLKSALQQMNLKNSPTWSNESAASTLNVCEPVGMSTTMTKPAQLKWVACKAGASPVTSLQQMLADEVTGLEKLQLGKKKMKASETPKPTNLSNCQGLLDALAKDLGGSLDEEHAKIIEMDMASLSNSTNVKCNSQNIGYTESTLPPFSPQTKLDMDVVSHVNPNEVLVLGRKERSIKSHSTFDSSVGLSQGSAGTISTVDKIEEIEKDCTRSKQKSPLPKIQLVAPLQRNVSCAAVDQHINSALNVGHDPVGMSSTILAHIKSLKQAIRKARASQVNPLQQVVAGEVARLEKLKEEEKLGKKKMKTLEILKSALQQTNLDNFQLVEASVEALAQDLGIVLEEEDEEIIDMDMAVSASLSSAADIEWSSQSSGCTKSLSPETVDLLFPINPRNEVFEKGEDILLPYPQFSRLSAETISTVDKVIEEIKVDGLSSKQESQLLGLQLVVDVAPLQRKMKESSGSKERSGLNEESVGGSSTDSATQFVEGSVWRLLQGFFQKRK